MNLTRRATYLILYQILQNTGCYIFTQLILGQPSHKIYLTIYFSSYGMHNRIKITTDDNRNNKKYMCKDIIMFTKTVFINFSILENSLCLTPSNS